MKTKTKVFLISALALGALFTGCSTSDPIIVCGREWNPGSRAVADTTSTFDLFDPLIVEFRYGTGFDFDYLTFRFYEGTLANRGKEVWSHRVRVNNKLSSYTLQGKAKGGGLVTAHEMTKQKGPGSVVVEVSSEKGPIVVKELTLVRNK